jgi:hypothetical protein
VATPASRPSFDRLFIIVSGVVLLAIIAINGWSLWRRSSAPAAAPIAEPSAEQPKDGAAPTAEAMPAEGTAFVGPIRPAEKPAKARARSAKGAVAVQGAAGAPEAATAEPAPPPARTTSQTSTPEPPPAAVLVPGSGAPPMAVKPFYSAADRDVTPPRALSPQLVAMLSQESPGVRPDVMLIAVVINEQGTVDSVQAVNNPETIGESVRVTAALSAVKAWHFRPALKDGSPVKYRQVVPVRLRANP